MDTKNSYIVVCDIKNPNVLKFINKLYENKPNVKVITSKDKEYYNLKKVDNYIFNYTEEIENLKSNISQMKSSNPDLVATCIDYCDSEKENDKDISPYTTGMEHLIKLISETGVLIHPGFINASNNNLFGKNVEQENYMDQNVENSLAYLVKQLENAYSVAMNKDEKKNLNYDIKQMKSGKNSNMDILANFINSTREEVLRSTMYKDKYTAGHISRVTNLSRIIGAELRLSSTESEVLQVMALMHDIGKIITPTEVLKYQGELKGEMKEAMNAHDDLGAKIFITMLKEYYKSVYRGKNSEEFSKNLKEANSIDEVIFKLSEYGLADDDVRKLITKIYSGISEHHKEQKDRSQEEKINNTFSEIEESDNVKKNLFVDIIQVSDSFDAATSDRDYNFPKTLPAIICDLAGGAMHDRYDKKVISALISNLTGKSLEESEKLISTEFINTQGEIRQKPGQYTISETRGVGEYGVYRKMYIDRAEKDVKVETIVKEKAEEEAKNNKLVYSEMDEVAKSKLDTKVLKELLITKMKSELEDNIKKDVSNYDELDEKQKSELIQKAIIPIVYEEIKTKVRNCVKGQEEIESQWFASDKDKNGEMVSKSKELYNAIYKKDGSFTTIDKIAKQFAGRINMNSNSFFDLRDKAVYEVCAELLRERGIVFENSSTTQKVNQGYLKIEEDRISKELIKTISTDIDSMKPLGKRMKNQVYSKEEIERNINDDNLDNPSGHDVIVNEII